MRTTSEKKEAGAILIFALGALLALVAAAAAAAWFAQGSLRLAATRRASLQAFYLAEAGLSRAEYLLRGGDPQLYFDSARAASGLSYTLGGGTVSVDIGPRGADGARSVRSVGIATGAVREVAARLRRFGLDPGDSVDCLRPGDSDGDGRCDGRPGIVAAADVSIVGGSLVDSYRGDSEDYSFSAARDRGHLAANGRVTLAGAGTRIRGWVATGEGVDLESNTIEGSVESLPPLLLPPLPPPSAVCSQHPNPALVDCAPPFGTVTATLAGSPPDETLTVRSGQTICMPAGEYCFRRIVVELGGTLRIVDDPASGLSTRPTTIHLGGESPAFEILGRLEFGRGMRPNLLRVFARGDVEVRGGSGTPLFGLFYAPGADVRLNTSGGGEVLEVFGAVYARNVLFGSSPVRFHVDEDARFGPFCLDGADPRCAPAFLLREEWEEVDG
jgi:hypothetical protein